MNGFSCGKHTIEKRNHVLVNYTKIVNFRKIYPKSIDMDENEKNIKKCLKKDTEFQNIYNKLQKILEKKQGYGIIKIQLGNILN